MSLGTARSEEGTAGDEGTTKGHLEVKWESRRLLRKGVVRLICCLDTEWGWGGMEEEVSHVKGGSVPREMTMTQNWNTSLLN